MPAMPAPEPPPMRERYRAHVRHEVKQAALRQLAESGPAAVSVSAIGKQLGVSGPALYRYFASRDEPLAELMIDAYHDLADALAAAGRAPAPGPRARLEGLARAYRSWALAQRSPWPADPPGVFILSAWRAGPRTAGRGRCPWMRSSRRFPGSRCRAGNSR